VPAPAGGDPQVYDAALVVAVEAFQRAQGLTADGAIGRRTRAALNGRAALSAAQVAANLERIRWVEIDEGARRIEVNLPEFMVTLRDGDAIEFRDRVVIGRLEEQTPEFSEAMEYLVLNPTWHVPSSIAVQDILPNLQRDPGYLASRSMYLVRRDGGPIPADPALHDFTQYSAANFPYRIRQTPNDDNALGLVKFMFPNDWSIYLHDTPRKDLFDKPSRAYSWGCVRVRNPLALAERLFAPQEADPAGFVSRVLASGRERYVNLERTVPVHILYRTVTVDGSGALKTFPDVYGRDAALIEALRRAGLDAPEA
jgi:murein L,D-transpeptidase YcbB/YkuD